MSKETPRGGDPKNSGRFSRVWGARKQAAGVYEKRALALKEKVTDPKKKDFYRYLELEQKKKNRGISSTEEATLNRLYMETMTPLQSGLFAGGTAAGLAGLFPLRMGNVQGASMGLGLALAGEGAIISSAAIGSARRNEALGISGFKLDRNLSNEESAAVNGAIGTISVLGAGGLLFWADRKMGGQLSMITAQKIGKLLGNTQVAKNIRPAATRNVASWKDMGDLPSSYVVFNKRVSADVIGEAETALSQSVRNAGGSFHEATMAYHGSPLVNPQVRAFHIEAAKILDIPDAMNFSHAKLSATRAVLQAGSIKSYATEIRMQYAATQRFLADQGIDYVDVVRGLGLTGDDARRYGLRVVTQMPKPGETPWVEMDALLPPLNSFSTSIKMSMAYALGRVVPVRGDVVVITRARVPRDKVYSFSGLGPGHSAEVVVTGGELPVQMIAVSKKFLQERMRALGNGATEEDALGTLWDIGLVAKSQEIARDKRIQAGLSLTGATLGLAALGTKGGAVATRGALKKAPQVAQRLRLTPKGAEAADKASLGLVTTASGVGGASGIHFANLQRKEAKQEEQMKVKKSWDLKVKEADDRRAAAEGRKAHLKALEAGRFLRLDQEPDSVMADKQYPTQRPVKAQNRPVAPPRRKYYGGIKLEDRRQRRMKGEQWGLAGVSGAAAVSAVGDKKETASRLRRATQTARQSRQLKRQAQAYASYEGNVRGPFKGNYKLQQLNIGRQQRAASKTAVNNLKAAGRSAVRIKPKTALLAGAAGAGAYGMSRMRRGQGRHYSDWWDG